MNRLISLLAFAILIAACATQSVEQQDIPETEVRTAPMRVEFPEGIPAPVGSVNDFADLVSAEDEEYMAEVIEFVQRQTGVQMAVLTVSSMEPYETIEDYSIAVANAWGVGSAERNDGVLVIVTVSERKVRIEVGYGLEETIPDSVAGWILDEYIIPNLSKGEYGTALRCGVDAIAELILDDYGD
ncbi:MAG: TPM domain-containing protein [Spirochaetaceae bacterium]|nr:TPM domain-containing protein [Spirochaetaceae bacterium]